MDRRASPQKRICYFGIYDPLYARSRVLVAGFKAHGYEVVHCTVSPRTHPGISKFRALYRAYRVLSDMHFEYVIVGFPGHSVVWFARLLFGNRIIFDAFVSLYDSDIEDRGLSGRYSLRALYARFLDRFSCRIARVVLLDTNVHREYFRNSVGVPLEKTIRVFVGVDPSIFYRRKEQKIQAHIPDVLLVTFYGSFIPLQGSDIIIEAIALLKDNPQLRFRIIGDGQEHEKALARAHQLGIFEQIEFMGKKSITELADLVAHTDISLGIFGTTAKASRVIPNKVFESAALGKAIITMDSPAIRELFTHGKNIFLSSAGSATSLANAIERLADDEPLRQSIADDAYRLTQLQLLPEKIVGDLLETLTREHFSLLGRGGGK